MAYVNVAEARKQGYSVSVSGDKVTATKTGPSASEIKGSYMVTKADGTQVYRKSGTNALGDYAVDRYVVYKEEGGRLLTGESRFISQTTKTAAPQETEAVYKADNTGTVKEGTGYAQRIEAQTKREAEIRAKNEAVYKLYGIQREETDDYLTSFTKALRRFPRETVGSAKIIGGRIAFAGESLFHKEGRAELKNAFGRVPGALKQAYNPKTGEGLFNIGVAVVSFKGVLKQAQTSYALKHSNTITATKSGTVTASGPQGAKSESVFVGSQKIGKSTYQIESTSKGTILNTKTGTQAKFDTVSNIGKVQGQNIKPIANIKSQSVGVQKGQTSVFLTKTQPNIKTVDIIKSQPVKGGVRYSGVELGTKGSLYDLKPNSAYAGASKNVYTQPRYTESGAYYDTVTLTKTGEISGGLNIKNTGFKPSASQLKALDSFKTQSVNTGAGTQTQLINTNLATTQTTLNQNVLVQTVKQIYKAENPAFISPLPSVFAQPQTIKPEGEVQPKTITETTITSKKIYKDIVKPTSIIKPETQSDLFVGPTGRTGSAQKDRTTPTYKPVFDVTVTPVTEIRPVQDQTIQPTQRQTQITRTRQKYQPIIRQPQIRPPIEIITAPPIKFGLEGNKRPGSPGFNVFVKSRGVFSKVNIKPLPREQAINFGAFRVGTTASATFKITPTNEEATGIFKGRGNLKDFYNKKSDSNIFIEKRGRRIKSPGEKFEITYKGIATRKARRRKK